MSIYSWQVLPYLLECSPNLSAFILHELHQHLRKPNCLMSYLQEIELHCFRGCEDGMEMTSYVPKELKCMSNCNYMTFHKQHPLHHPHRLILLAESNSTNRLFRCNGCRCEGNGFSYKCEI